MKLSDDQIRFIDTYLKNSGIKYLDVRYEMTDHIATALEAVDGNFNENFRQYMLEHKQELLASNRQFGKLAGKNAVRLILRNLAAPRFLVLSIIFFCLLYFLTQIFTAEIITEICGGTQLLAMAAFIFHYKYSRGSRNMKFSIIDKVFGIVAVSIYCVVLFVRPDNWLDNQILMVCHAVFSAFFIEILFTFRQLTQKYKLQYGS